MYTSRHIHLCEPKCKSFIRLSTTITFELRNKVVYQLKKNKMYAVWIQDPSQASLCSMAPI